jgi:hypothetical protein
MKPYLRVLAKSIGGAAILAFAACIFCGTGFSQTQQEHVHHNAHKVMPFDISRAVHIFKWSNPVRNVRHPPHHSGASMVRCAAFRARCQRRFRVRLLASQHI